MIRTFHRLRYFLGRLWEIAYLSSIPLHFKFTVKNKTNCWYSEYLIYNSRYFFHQGAKLRRYSVAFHEQLEKLISEDLELAVRKLTAMTMGWSDKIGHNPFEKMVKTISESETKMDNELRFLRSTGDYQRFNREVLKPFSIALQGMINKSVKLSARGYVTPVVPEYLVRNLLPAAVTLQVLTALSEEIVRHSNATGQPVSYAP